MKTNAPVDELSPTRQVALGCAIAGVGLVTAWIVHTHPERLRAPIWLVFAACSCFVIAGAAVALRPFSSRRAYAWAMAVLLAVMTAIPGWIAFGPGERHCASSLFVPLAEFGCRIALGVSAAIMAGLTVIAVALAHKAKNEA